MAAKDSTGVDFSKCIGFKYDPVPVILAASSSHVKIGGLEQAGDSSVCQFCGR